MLTIGTRVTAQTASGSTVTGTIVATYPDGYDVNYRGLIGPKRLNHVPEFLITVLPTPALAEGSMDTQWENHQGSFYDQFDNLNWAAAN